MIYIYYTQIRGKESRYISMNMNNRGFTLLELMVTIAIIAILASVAVPSYQAIIDNTENSLALANINIIRKFVTMSIIGDDFY